MEFHQGQHLKLFILYINDMCNVSKLVKFFLFADDSNIFCSANDIQLLENIVCNEIYKMQLWFSINKLSINIKIQNTHILIARVTKFLGVFIDESLNWKDHISRVKAKLSTSVGVVYRCSQVVAIYIAL